MRPRKSGVFRVVAPWPLAESLAAVVEGADGLFVVGALNEYGPAKRHSPAENRNEGDGGLCYGDEPKGNNGKNQRYVVVGLMVAGKEIVAIRI
jgi:hypothetical protein